MKIINADNDRVIAEHLQVAANFLGRFKGLMGTDALPEGSALLLTPCSSIHTFFMRYPIDAVFLDDDHRVLLILDSIKPHRWSPLVRRAKSVLELPAGRCRQTSTKIGDKFQIMGER